MINQTDDANLVVETEPKKASEEQSKQQQETNDWQSPRASVGAQLANHADPTAKGQRLEESKSVQEI